MSKPKKAPDTSKPKELWDYARIAKETGLSVGTLRRYKKTGHMPGPDESPAPDRPRWYPETIKTWMAGRPGRGTRTDLPGRGTRTDPKGSN